MKAEDIVRQLMFRLPFYSDAFTDDISVSSITSAALVATVNTSVVHTLNTNDFAHISNTLVPNTIVVMTQVDGIASAETAIDHDLTANYQQNVQITGANEAQYNGSHKFITDINRRNFTFEIDSGAPVTATGSPLLLEDLKRFKYNGWHEVTKVTDNQFTFPLEKAIGSPAYGNPTLQIKPRVSAAATLELAIDSYTKQNNGELWAYVVLDNMIANKDRSETTDATYYPRQQTVYRQLVLQDFHVYVFFPTTQQIAARIGRDTTDDVLQALCKALLRLRLDTPFIDPNDGGVVFVGSEFGSYENAFYIHDFLFQSQAWITYDDTIDEDISVAFRDIEEQFTSDFIDDDEVKMEGNINLDDEPLS